MRYGSLEPYIKGYSIDFLLFGIKHLQLKHLLYQPTGML